MPRHGGASSFVARIPFGGKRRHRTKQDNRIRSRLPV